ncbi:uncharacterized protein [Prorops nasuta]|uniref:uncharacterized protein isoform X2 n=1 Tax=Prorops nasuta TaxID=863751 RepID=UPI0034CEE2B1
MDDELFSQRKRGRPPKRSRGRPKKSIAINSDTEYLPSLPYSTSDDKWNCDTNVDNHLENNTSTGESNNKHGKTTLLIRANEKYNDAMVKHTNLERLGNDISRDDTKNPISQSNQMVKCCRCNENVLKFQWASHNLHRHNNMGWREHDTPIDLENDLQLLRKILAVTIKKKRGKLNCEQCNDVKRSVNGFLSHLQFCGKSEEEQKALLMTCPVCKAIMKPSSISFHERFHRQMEQKKLLQESSDSQEGKSKRKAAERAVSKIQEFTEQVADDPLTKRAKMNNMSFRNLISFPKYVRRIPGIIKKQWNDNLVSVGKAKCRTATCTFISSSYKDICEHYAKCGFAAQSDYRCKICKFSTLLEKEIYDHIEEIHANDADGKSSDREDYVVGESEDEDELNAKKYRILKSLSHSLDRSKTLNTFEFLPQRYKMNWDKTYNPVLKWTLEFELKNYKLQLFEKFSPNNFVPIQTNDYKKYLPKLEVSMVTKSVNAYKSEGIDNSKIEWKVFKIFESGFDNDIPMFFAGGPVWALAWLPIPAPSMQNNCNQFLAVSCHPDPDNNYAVGKAYSAYCIAHDNGTVWCLEWCPSGCYETKELNYLVKDKVTRMGLLAAACSDSSVQIYSLPFPQELKLKRTNQSSKKEYPIYKTDPLITLVVCTEMYDNNKQNWQCTKLSWSKEHSHNILAAGFSNGYIALWDLATESPLLNEKRQNTIFMIPYKHFYAHAHAISMLTIIPHSKNRFIASGSIDRLYKVWDVEDINIPQECVKKGIISNGEWMTHWSCAMISFDDALGWKHTNSYLIPVREHGFKLCPILPTNSSVYGVAVSDHTNAVAQGTLAGDIITIFPQQLLYYRDIEKVIPKNRRINSFVKIIDFKEEMSENSKLNKKDTKLSKEYHYMPETYEGCKRRFGIIFCDNLTTEKEETAKESKSKWYPFELPLSKIEQYPFASVNRVTWNPNTVSCLWMAAGYQNGLVRLLNFKFMNMNNEIDKLFPKHVEAMLNANKDSIETNYAMA